MYRPSPRVEFVEGRRGRSSDPDGSPPAGPSRQRRREGRRREGEPEAARRGRRGERRAEAGGDRHVGRRRRRVRGAACLFSPCLCGRGRIPLGAAPRWR
jgi:hypothetical protein